MEHDTKPVLGYILKGYPRISETFISNEILQLEKLGFQIVIFPMRKPRENFTHKSVEQITAPVHYLPTHLFRDFFKLLSPNLILLISRPHRYLRALGFALRRFSRTRKSATFKHLFQAGYMVQKHILQQSPVDHLHGHFAHSPTSVTMFASQLTGLPFSFTAHAKDIYTSNTAQLREKICKAKFVLTCTRFNKKYLESLGADSPTSIHCIYHGIDLNLFSFKGARTRCSEPYSLLTVARLTEKKGLPTLYSALAELRNRGVHFQHTLIGDGDDREHIIGLMKQLKLESHCTWAGTQTHEQVLDCFRRSDLFVLSCQVAKNGDRDGIPNVLVESLAMGIPVVSTKVSAIPELVKNKETGLIIEPENHLELADAIEESLTNETLRNTVIQTGQEFVQSTFDNRELAKKLASVFIHYYNQ